MSVDQFPNITHTRTHMRSSKHVGFLGSSGAFVSNVCVRQFKDVAVLTVSAAGLLAKAAVHFRQHMCMCVYPRLLVSDKKAEMNPPTLERQT